MKLDNNNHSVFLMYYHLVLAVKYRRKVIAPAISEQKGRAIIKADKFYPSSQLCSDCGYRNKEVKNLKVRE